MFAVSIFAQSHKITQSGINLTLTTFTWNDMNFSALVHKDVYDEDENKFVY